MAESRNTEAWYIIVNPNAGKRLGERDWHKIESLLNQYGLQHRVRFTQSKGHAIQLTREGTMNEVVNGCFRQKVCSTTELCLSAITVGTGNDWGRMFGIPTSYGEAVRIIHEKKTCLHDTGVVRYFRGAQRDKRYFINIAGLGFDALVVKRTNRQKEKGRKGWGRD